MESEISEQRNHFAQQRISSGWPGDILLFEITVTDKTGVNVVDAINAITIKVEGGGKLIGVDNGELDYTGLFKTNTRNAYQGRLLVSVQKTSPASGFSVTATSPELTSAIFQTE